MMAPPPPPPMGVRAPAQARCLTQIHLMEQQGLVHIPTGMSRGSTAQTSCRFLTRTERERVREATGAADDGRYGPTTGAGPQMTTNVRRCYHWRWLLLVLLLQHIPASQACNVIRRDTEVPCASLGRFRSGGVEECASRCLDEPACDYIRGEPRSATGPGYSDCELLGRCTAILAASTHGVQGGLAELRSRSCFSREEDHTVTEAELSIGATVIAFVCALLLFALPACWWCSKKRAESRAAARLAVVSLDLPSAGAIHSDLDEALHSDERHIHAHLDAARAASDVRYAAKIAAKRRARGLTEGDWARRSAVESYNVQQEHEATADSEMADMMLEELHADEEAVADDVEAREAEHAVLYSDKVAEKRRLRNMTAGVFAHSAATRMASHAEKVRLREEEAEAKREQQRREQEETEEAERRAEEDMRLARLDAERAAVAEAEAARLALEEETARKLEEDQRRAEEERAWHLAQQSRVAEEAKRRENDIAAGRARREAQERNEKLRKAARKTAAEREASAAGEAAADRVARRAQDIITAMSPRPPRDDSVMLALATGTPPLPPPTPIAQNLLERHSDKRLVAFEGGGGDSEPLIPEPPLHPNPRPARGHR
jgi:hypothetical protein